MEEISRHILQHNNHEVILNTWLIHEKHLNQDGVDKILELHAERLDIEDAMDESSDVGELGIYLDQWHENQHKLQEAWGFNRDINYHRFWDIPKCKCPVSDNLARIGTKHAVHVQKCPLHGWE